MNIQLHFLVSVNLKRTELVSKGYMHAPRTQDKIGFEHASWPLFQDCIRDHGK